MDFASSSTINNRNMRYVFFSITHLLSPTEIPQCLLMREHNSCPWHWKEWVSHLWSLTDSSSTDTMSTVRRPPGPALALMLAWGTTSYSSAVAVWIISADREVNVTQAAHRDMFRKVLHLKIIQGALGIGPSSGPMISHLD